MIRMKNKLHGFCHAYNKNDEDYLRNLGWIPEDESFCDEEKSNEITDVESKEITEIIDSPQPDKARRGRKPKSGA